MSYSKTAKQKAEMIPLMNKTRAALDEIEARLEASLDEIKAWESRLDTPLTPEELQAYRDNLIMAYGRLRVTQGQYDKLLEFMLNTASQYQSAKDAYGHGWHARLIDILARLDVRDAADLRRSLLEMDSDDNMPF